NGVPQDADRPLEAVVRQQQRERHPIHHREEHDHGEGEDEPETKPAGPLGDALERSRRSGHRRQYSESAAPARYNDGISTGRGSRMTDVDALVQANEAFYQAFESLDTDRMRAVWRDAD